MMNEIRVTTVAILHDFHDAEWVCIHRDEYRDVHLVATHASVIDYFEPRQIGCEYLSSYLKNGELPKLYAGSVEAESILTELDRAISPAINEKLGMDPPLKFFYDCYRYLGRYEYFNHRKLELALDRLIHAHHVETVILFKSRSPVSASSFFTTGLDVFEILLKEKNIAVDTPVMPVSKKLIGREKMRHRFTKARKALRFVISKLQSGFLSGSLQFNALGRREASPVSIKLEVPVPLLLLSLDGENSNGLIPEDLQIRGLPGVSLNGAMEGHSPAETAIDWHGLIAQAEQMLLESRKLLDEGGVDDRILLKAIVLDDFVSNFRKYLVPLLRLPSMEQVTPIGGAIWTSPPISPGAKPLMIDYLLQRKKWVVGRQHGGNYGIEKSHPRHFDSDYSWCSHFLSFGFTLNDLMKTDPPGSPHCEIIPVGMPGKPAAHTHAEKKHVDLLFPISNATYFHRDSVRPLQHDLAQIQRGLLCFLDQWRDRRVIVKPFPMYDYQTSSFSELLRSLKNVEVVDHLDLAACFEEYDIDSVATEYVSSPLFECLRHDVEVLAIRNPLIPLSAEADGILRRRVHFFDNLKDIETGISELFLGKLPRLRDPEFANRFLPPYDGRAASAFWREIIYPESTN
jgi:hypothetical protein